MPDDEARDQETDLEALGEDDDASHEMPLRYGVTAQEATHHEPLDVSLAQEEPDAVYVDDGVWDEVVDDAPAPPRTRVVEDPADLDEEQVPVAAEQAAMHSEDER